MAARSDATSLVPLLACGKVQAKFMVAAARRYYPRIGMNVAVVEDCAPDLLLARTTVARPCGNRVVAGERHCDGRAPRNRTGAHH